MTHAAPTPKSLAAVTNPTLRFGLVLSAAIPQDPHELGVTSGLLIEGVSGAAERAGVQPGDLLLAINDKPVTSINQAGVAAGLADKSVALLVQRDGIKIYIPLRLG
jgi:serine protease Do